MSAGRAARTVAWVTGNALGDFAKVNAGVLSPAVFFGEDNVRRIMSQTAP